MATDSLDLKNILMSKSPYIYQSDLAKIRTERDSARQGKELSKHEVNYLWDQGYFTISDLQLVKLIADNIFCSTRMLKKSLILFRRNTENKEISVLSDEKHLRDRLRVLVKCEMLIKYTLRSFKNEDKTDVEHYYCVSPHGYNYIKRQLYFKKNYDEYLSSLPVEEVFKYLSTVMACQSFGSVHGFMEYSIDTSFYSKQFKQKTKLYGQVKLNNNDKSYRVIVEPLKFEYEPTKITKTTWDILISERFSIIKESLCELQKEYPSEHINLMMVCNDFVSIKEAISLARTQLSDYMNLIYFVIDSVIDKYSLNSTCLQVDSNNSVIACTPDFV